MRAVPLTNPGAEATGDNQSELVTFPATNSLSEPFRTVKQSMLPSLPSPGSNLGLFSQNAHQGFFLHLITHRLAPRHTREENNGTDGNN
jgi:hypothetical protein